MGTIITLVSLPEGARDLRTTLEQVHTTSLRKGERTLLAEWFDRLADGD